MAKITSAEEVLRQLGGTAAEVDREIQRFRQAARVLSSSHPRLIEQYPKQWVVVHKGKVEAHAKKFASVMKQISEKNLPREHVIIRFIDRNRRAMIL